MENNISQLNILQDKEEPKLKNWVKPQMNIIEMKTGHLMSTAEAEYFSPPSS